MRTIAPAKINWTLEVLGKREDGYHEIRSVMQTIDLCDEVSAERADESIYETMDRKALASDDLIVQAAKALEERVGRSLPARIRLEKRIPTASGLGGGSSDAAATLRLLNGLYGLGLSQEEVASIGATVGSDVPFFVYGGTALIEGRGERVATLPDVEAAWLAIVVPAVEMAEKTSRMYAQLTASDYTDGLHTDKVVRAVSNGIVINDIDLFNVFDRHVFDVMKELGALSHGLFLEVLSSVHVSGSGPAIFVCCGSHARAESRAEDAVAYAEAFTVGTAGTFLVRTLGRSQATSLANQSGSPI